VAASSHVPLYSLVESTQRVYGVRLIFVSARTNKRHHHQGSGTAIKQLTCHECQRIVGSAQGLTSHLKDSYRCPSSSNYQQSTAEPARRVLQRAEASNALHQISALASDRIWFFPKKFQNFPKQQRARRRQICLLYAACILTMHTLYPLACIKRNIFYS
jgi:hypothetical protein